uniref:ABC transmembrane type-1 domain-containing protein n=1 Tax=Graphocephala atropunctata TaxID=36148 RepID=A0A1B6MMU4_9HEMI
MWSMHILQSASKPLCRKFSGNNLLRDVRYIVKHRNNVLLNSRSYSINNYSNGVNIFLRLRNHSGKALTLVSGYYGYSVWRYGTVTTVDCTASTVDKQSQAPAFDWKRFFELIWPDIWSLLGAIVAALAAAVMNIQIPIYLGTVINVMTRYVGTAAPGNFNTEMQGPVFSILGLYAAQSVATFIYIYLLSNLGERLATRLKCQLYASILRQDLAFFDQKRTGDLVDCITSDVQEFKSAFKMVVSQGLRSLTQTCP